MDPLISVVVPVHNGQDYLENCIKSIQEQTYQNKGIILVNDGSTDRTGEICKGLIDKYSNIQVISMGDEGVSAARNAGISKAGGEYLMFVDADDRLHPNMLQVLYDALVRTGSDVAGCGFFSWGSEEEWGHRIRANGDAGNQYTTVQRNELVKQIAEGRDTRCWAKLYKRDTVGEHRFRRGLTIGEDMLFLLDILPDINEMVSVDFPGYGYYQNPAGAMNRKFTSEYMDQITCWEIARTLIMQTDNSMEAKVTEKLLMAIMLVVGKLALLPGDERKMQQENVRACLQKLRENLQVEGAYGCLPQGYKLKIKLFSKMPSLYLWMYHFWKLL